MKIEDEEYFDGLKEWYLKALNSDSKYIVFLGRRAWQLANILQDVTGQKMIDTKDKKYLSESAFMAQINVIIDEYKNKKEKSEILLCNDINISGQSTCDVTWPYGYKIEENILTTDDSNFLFNSIKINTYMYSTCTINYNQLISNNILFSDKLYEIYEFICKSEKVLSNSNIPMFPYLYTEQISKDQFDLISKNDYVETKYYQHEFIDVDLININGIKGISTLRLIEKANNTYMVIPHLFLTDLDYRKTMTLINMLKEKMKTTSNLPVEKIDEAFRIIASTDKCTSEELVNVNRNLNEFISFVLSYSIISDFNNKNNIKLSKDEIEKEIIRLTRNFNYSDFEFWKSFIADIIKNPIITSKDELRDIIKNLKVNNNLLKYKYSNGKSNLNDILALYFYTLSSRENDYKDRFARLGSSKIKYHPQHADSIEVVLNHLVNKCGNIDMAMANFFQYIDFGMGNITQHSYSDKEEKGYATYINPTKHALSIYPSKYFKYLEMLSIFDEAVSYKDSIKYRPVQIEKMHKLLDKLTSLTEEEKKELKTFYEYQKLTAQDITIWSHIILEIIPPEIEKLSIKENLKMWDTINDYDEEAKKLVKDNYTYIVRGN